jgi:hypothetical protein
MSLAAVPSLPRRVRRRRVLQSRLLPRQSLRVLVLVLVLLVVQASTRPRAAALTASARRWTRCLERTW